MAAKKQGKSTSRAGKNGGAKKSARAKPSTAQHREKAKSAPKKAPKLPKKAPKLPAAKKSAPVKKVAPAAKATKKAVPPPRPSGTTKKLPLEAPRGRSSETQLKGKPTKPEPKGKPAAKGKPAPEVKGKGKALIAPPPKGGKGGGRGAAPARPSAPPRPAPMREPPRLVSVPLPLLPPPRRASVEERAASIDKRLTAQGDEFRRHYIDSLDMSWIYHDSALEGVVYTFEELRAGLGGAPVPMTDSSLQPTYDDIRRHKEAIEFVRDFGEKKRLPVTMDVVKKIYLILHPEEGDIKTVKYRKDIPQHRLYFHEYTPPDKVGYKVRQVVDWLNDPETRKTRNGIRIAARAHYDLLRVYPFPTDSGKVSRLFMNLLLMRSGLPPAIIHSTERQRYYEALKGSATIVLQMVQEAVENALSSVEKLLDEQESRKRGFVS